jgi:hypothetical protein
MTSVERVGVLIGIVVVTACGRTDRGVEEQIADAVFTVLAADREVYTKQVVHRLQNEEAVIKASERWREERLLPLPAQMFRMGAENAQGRSERFTYALLSLWPINKQNAPRTPAERAGLEAVRKGDPYRADEEVAGTSYFTAVYPDRAVSKACIECHNDHPDSPRRDFALGDVMGGVVIRVKRR